MKDSFQRIRNYVLLGFAITILLVSAKILIEQTPVGLRIEMFTFEALQSVLSTFNSKEELPAVVVDISDIQGNSEQIIELPRLQEVISAIAEQRPRAIAIDVVLNPADSDYAEQNNSAKTNPLQAKDYYDFLDFCMKLKAEKNIPIFLAVGMRGTYGQPEDWLGQEKYKELAAAVIISKGDKTRMPIWLKASPEAEKLFSLGVYLARAYTKSRLPNAISWAIKTTEEGLPGTQKDLQEGIEYADAPVNYSKLDTFQQNKLFTLSSNSVKEAGEKFHHKIVLLGDGTLKKAKAADVSNVPDQSQPVPNVYLQACAFYTFARAPLYEFNLTARLALDICLTLLAFGGAAILRYSHLRDRSDKQQAVFIYIIKNAILLATVVIVYWLGLLWLDFLLIAIALWLHPTFEKKVLRLYTAPHIPAYIDNKQEEYDRAEILNRALNVEPDNVQVLKAKGDTKFKSERSMNSDKRKILFIAANPTNASRLQTDKEHRIIKAEMERGSHRDVFEFLQPQLAVTITELLRAMNTRPNIVHFSGHGKTEGIVITKDDNKKQLLTNEILERLFKPLKDCTEIVVLNSCYSASQAEFISKLGMYVVGNNLPIGDDATISFAKGLYNGLGEGKSFEDAINDARIVVMTESPGYASVIEIWKCGDRLDI